MSNLTVFGPLIDATVLERAVIRLLGGGRALAEDDTAGWLDTYLAEVEDRTPGLEKGDIGRPNSWQTDIDTRDFPETELPAIAVIVGDDDPESDGQFLHATFSVEVGAIVRGATRQESRDLSRWYATAIKAAVMHQATREGVAQDVTYAGTDWGEVSGNPGRIAAVCEVSFVMTVQGTLDLFAGPTQPDPEPVPPDVPDWPTYPGDPTVADGDPTVIAIPVPADQEFTP